MVDAFKRYQKRLTLYHLFPQEDKSLCSCGCKQPLSGRQKRWASKACNKKALLVFYIIKGDAQVIRQELFKIEGGVCQVCYNKTKTWEADHILPVFMGGGACYMDNFQTLCKSCHTSKSSYMTSQRADISRAVDSKCSNLRLTADLLPEYF